MSNGLPPGCTDADVDLSLFRYYAEGFEAAAEGRGRGCCRYFGRAADQWYSGYDCHAEQDAAEQEGTP